MPLTNVKNNRLSKLMRPASPLKSNSNNGHHIGNAGGGGGGDKINLQPQQNKSDSFVVHPRIVTLIRNGTKPRRILRLLLNKRNSATYEHVLTAITQCVKLDTGCVRKVFTATGVPVLTLADFFDAEDVFFAYGTERMGGPDDFKLEADEQKGVQQTRKTLRNGTARSGPIPKMPIKNSVNLHNTTYESIDETFICDSGINRQDLPEKIQSDYVLGKIIGDGNFAIVLKVKSKQTGQDYALKIIDKSKCKGKEHYIDAEVRVMKKLQHPHIMSMILDVDTAANMFLVLEYVSGKCDDILIILLLLLFANEQMGKGDQCLDNISEKRGCRG